MAHPRLTEDERAIRLSTARSIILGLLPFSTLRYYAQALAAVKIDPDGSVFCSLTLRVPAQEISDQLWKDAQPTWSQTNAIAPGHYAKRYKPE